MFLEIPLISQWTLFLNTPIAAFTSVVGILLLSTGVGSMSVNQNLIRHKWIVRISFLIGLGFVLFCTVSKGLILSWPIWIRFLVLCMGLIPLGFSMGTFFPQGISWIKRTHPDQVPWAWAINGSTSVIASVSTSILSVQGGFPFVLILGSCVYLIAWMILGTMED
jgi:hypothetical protein